jgi:hypothetical protein
VPLTSLNQFPHMLPLSGLGSNQRSNMDEIAQVPPIQKKQPKDASSFVSVVSNHSSMNI